MFEMQLQEPGHVLANMEPMARDLDSLEAAVSLVRAQDRAEPVFNKMWEAVGPGRGAKIAEIEAVLAKS